MIRKTLKGTSLSLSPAIEQTVDKIINTLESYIDPDDTSALAEIEVSRTSYHHKSGDIFRAEINFHSRHGNARVESLKPDLYSALMTTRDELTDILRSRKSKRIHFLKKSGLVLKNMLRGLPWKKWKK